MRLHSDEQDWAPVVFKVFDIPNCPLHFEERVKEMQHVIQPKPNIAVVTFTKCNGSDHLHQILDEILLGGGEGVTIRKPNSPYVGQRTRIAQKLKAI
jgi:DNA ligase-1